MLRLFESRPDHPLADPGELSRVVEATQGESPAGALEDLKHWLGTLREFEGFSFAERFAIVKKLDEAARPLATEIFAAFLTDIHRRDKAERARETLLQSYWDDLCGAYAKCVADDERSGKGAGKQGEDLALALTRSFQAAFLAAKVRCMLYLPIPPNYANAAYQLLAFAEVAHFDTTIVRPYEREIRSSPRTELLKLLAFELCEPHELPPEQVELAAHILDRLAVTFAWSRTASPECTAYVDLAAGGPPRRADGATASPAMRHFGAGPALAKLAELEKMSAQNLASEELRFGKEFTPTQIVTVIRHLLRYLGRKPPRRAETRSQGGGKVEVLRGFQAICASVTAIDVGASLQEDLKVSVQKEKGGLQMQEEALDVRPESWNLVDASPWGVGATIPPGLGAWVEPGVLCGLRQSADSPWAVGIVRRLDSSGAGPARCGLQILSRKPVSVWLRALGRQGEEVAHWETSTGSFAYDYARAIVLPDAAKSEGRPVLLLAGGKFIPDQICEVVMGEHSRHLKLAAFLEEGADYIRAAFAWMAPGKA